MNLAGCFLRWSSWEREQHPVRQESRFGFIPEIHISMIWLREVCVLDRRVSELLPISILTNTGFSHLKWISSAQSCPTHTHTNPTPKLPITGNIMHFYIFNITLFSVFLKPFEIRGLRKCPHSRSRCNASVIPM